MSRIKAIRPYTVAIETQVHCYIYTYRPLHLLHLHLIALSLQLT